jgi:hypothetical protein
MTCLEIENGSDWVRKNELTITLGGKAFRKRRKSGLKNGGES